MTLAPGSRITEEVLQPLPCLSSTLQFYFLYGASLVFPSFSLPNKTPPGQELGLMHVPITVVQRSPSFLEAIDK